MRHNNSLHQTFDGAEFIRQAKSMSTRDEFIRREERLAEVCAQMASALAKATDPDSVAAHSELLRLNHVFTVGVALDEKKEEAGFFRGMYHKDGFQDYPPAGISRDQWREIADEGFSLSTIYSELRFAEMRGLPDR